MLHTWWQNSYRYYGKPQDDNENVSNPVAVSSELLDQMVVYEDHPGQIVEGGEASGPVVEAPAEPSGPVVEIESLSVV